MVVVNNAMLCHSAPFASHWIIVFKPRPLRVKVGEMEEVSSRNSHHCARLLEVQGVRLRQRHSGRPTLVSRHRFLLRRTTANWK